jgi:hypothetical protein
MSDTNPTNNKAPIELTVVYDSANAQIIVKEGERVLYTIQNTQGMWFEHPSGRAAHPSTIDALIDVYRLRP